jgi:hypothetical protein
MVSLFGFLFLQSILSFHAYMFSGRMDDIKNRLLALIERLDKFVLGPDSKDQLRELDGLLSEIESELVEWTNSSSSSSIAETQKELRARLELLQKCV